MKHLVDIDEAALSEARASLRTVTIKDTVNAALRLAADDSAREAQIDAALAALSAVDPTDDDRSAAWS